MVVFTAYEVVLLTPGRKTSRAEQDLTGGCMQEEGGQLTATEGSEGGVEETSIWGTDQGTGSYENLARVGTVQINGAEYSRSLWGCLCRVVDVGPSVTRG